MLFRGLPGSGKSRIMGALIASSSAPTVVVCPGHLLPMWEAELQLVAPELRLKNPGLPLAGPKWAFVRVYSDRDGTREGATGSTCSGFCLPEPSAAPGL